MPLEGGGWEWLRRDLRERSGMFQGPPLGSISYSGHSAHLVEFCPPICGPIRLWVPGGRDEVWLTTISPAPSTVAGLGQRQCALDERGEGGGGGHEDPPSWPPGTGSTGDQGPVTVLRGGGHTTTRDQTQQNPEAVLFLGDTGPLDGQLWLEASLTEPARPHSSLECSPAILLPSLLHLGQTCIPSRNLLWQKPCKVHPVLASASQKIQTHREGGNEGVRKGPSLGSVPSHALKASRWRHLRAADFYVALCCSFLSALPPPLACWRGKEWPVCFV